MYAGPFFKRVVNIPRSLCLVVGGVMHVGGVISWGCNDHKSIFTIANIIIGHIRFFGDLFHAVAPLEYCLSPCWLVLKQMRHTDAKMIWLRAQVACLTICFTFFFLMLLCSSTSTAIILHTLCRLSFLSILYVFLFDVSLVESFHLTAHVHSVDLLDSVWTSSCLTELTCLEAAS